MIPFCFRHKGTLSSLCHGTCFRDSCPRFTLLEQQRIIVAREFLGILEHSEKKVGKRRVEITVQFPTDVSDYVLVMGYRPEIYLQLRKWIIKGTRLQTDEYIC
ncbi:hypothetical protein AVEN_145148-1 [Araneus ventricosus]|uniref:Uncharacterized protein n=1 Tax=Araneus ventricosus TaxID=182803 RepID=A0A4Y2R133_ARAVE|nr:hypothetical protein AVEN_145148-1 [Araneus ventricosus]